MGTLKSKPEIYLLYNIGFSPTDIMDMGFSKGTAYKYFRRYSEAKLRLIKLLTNGFMISKDCKAIEQVERD